MTATNVHCSFQANGSEGGGGDVLELDFTKRQKNKDI